MKTVNTNLWNISKTAFLIVLAALSIELVFTPILVSESQWDLIELLGEEESAKEETEKEKEKEEDIKVRDGFVLTTLHVPQLLSMMHALTDHVEHLHFESVPTPPPECV